MLRIMIFIFCLGCIMQCKDSHKSDHQAKPKAQNTDYTGTTTMIDSLTNIRQRIVYNMQTFETLKELEALDQRIKSGQEKKEIQTFVNFAYLQLQAGKLEEAIKSFQQIFNISESLQVINDNTIHLHKTYAVAHLRLGEVNNCVKNHNAESCLFPIKGEAIHIDKTGSSKAIEIYKQILEKYPKDYQSIWLINLAYMTLGEYPDGVPSKYLIPPSKFKDNTGIPTFVNKGSDYGIDVNELSGASIFDDFDNDGDPDLMCSNWALTGQLRYYENVEGKMTERTTQAKLTGLYGGLNMKQADYNNDGYLDVFVVRGAWRKGLSQGIYPNSLLRNNGDGTFTDVTIESGLYHIGPSQALAWLDVDNDGWLDIYVANESIPSNVSEWSKNNLFINDGNGKFVDFASNLGVDYLGYFKGVATSDYDNDGDIDLYITNLNGDNIFLHNMLKETGQLSFENRINITNTVQPDRSFPCWFFDYDNDGYDDLYVSAYDDFLAVGQTAEVTKSYLGLPFKTGTPRLYHNKGDGTFINVTKEAYLDIPLHTMGCNYGDINNDGYEDFYLGTGAPDLRFVIPNRLFVNDNGHRFKDATFSANVGSIQKGHGVSFVDVDMDGDLDIYTVLGGAYSGDFFHNALFVNPGNNNQWIKIKLIGTSTNKYALGSKIKITYKSKNGETKNVYKTLSSGASFGANELQVHAGLSDAVEIISIEVRWANGSTNFINYGSAPLKKLIVITEGNNNIEIKETHIQELKEKMHHHH